MKYLTAGNLRSEELFSSQFESAVYRGREGTAQEPGVSGHITTADRKQKARMSEVRLISKPGTGDVAHSEACMKV